MSSIRCTSIFWKQSCRHLLQGRRGLFSKSNSSPEASNKMKAESEYYQHTLPKRIIMIRHGESLGNVDENMYAEIPDWKIPLTRRGERQAKKAAQDLSHLTQGECIFAYCSPYKRTLETWDIMQQCMANPSDGDETTSAADGHNPTRVKIIGTRQEPRIAEQQFGNFQNPRKVRTAKAERRTFGRFFFRFPNGEAGLDVYNRVSSFLATVTRDLAQIYNHDPAVMQDMNLVIVTHGLTLRLLLMRYFQLTVEEFELSYNSQNAKLVVMNRFVDRENNREFYRLEEVAKEALNLKGDISNEKPAFWRGHTLDFDSYGEEPPP